MKKLIFIMILCCSCSQETINETENLGTFKVDDKFYETDNYVTSQITNCEKNDIRQFNSNGTFYFNYHVNVGNNCFEDNNETGTWLIENNLLKIYYSENDPVYGNEFVFEIIEISNNNLILKYYLESLNTNVLVKYIKQ